MEENQKILNKKSAEIILKKIKEYIDNTSEKIECEYYPIDNVEDILDNSNK